MMRAQRVSIFQVGSFEILREHSFSDQGHVARSHCIICPKCRLIWADLRFPDDPFSWPTIGFCEAHPIADTWCPVAGSILSEEGWGVIDDSLLHALPERVVEREFKLHLKAFGVGI